MRDMLSFWDLAYVLGAPWDRGQPREELTELVEEGGLAWRFGPPGIDRREVQNRFSKNFQIRDERELETYRTMLFYQMKRLK